MWTGSVNSAPLSFHTHLKFSEIKMGNECGRQLPGEMVQVQGPSPRSESVEYPPLPAPHHPPLQGCGGHKEGALSRWCLGDVSICVEARGPGVLAVRGIKATDVCFPTPFMFLSMATTNSDNESVMGSPRCAQCSLVGMGTGRPREGQSLRVWI